jgi:hypothetical protein
MNMTLDKNLLEKAAEAGARLADAERQALLSRADYHSAIRRLHLAGASLREIARTLSLSHQRVQQIVSAAGGSWWMVWRSRRVTRDAVCTWCDRPPSEVSKLIAGPNVYVCDRCVEAAEHAMRGADRRGDTGHWSKAGPRSRCAFCRKRANENRSLVAGPPDICSECLRTCREILDGRAA